MPSQVTLDNGRKWSEGTQVCTNRDEWCVITDFNWSIWSMGCCWYQWYLIFIIYIDISSVHIWRYNFLTKRVQLLEIAGKTLTKLNFKVSLKLQKYLVHCHHISKYFWNIPNCAILVWWNNLDWQNIIPPQSRFSCSRMTFYHNWFWFGKNQD